MQWYLLYFSIHLKFYTLSITNHNLRFRALCLSLIWSFQNLVMIQQQREKEKRKNNFLENTNIPLWISEYWQLIEDDNESSTLASLGRDQWLIDWFRFAFFELFVFLRSSRQGNVKNYRRKMKEKSELITLKHFEVVESIDVHPTELGVDSSLFE